ncbi:MBL fold metallo-hydrolase [Flavobacterium salilacus subsp. salilacus]|uniref:MBL fold metallo-hydrolase n=1 Tax=Flavobacterium TaxID=237 RepID=UPI001074D04C|nr:MULTISPECIES: MBL fold metallo-hydrolase [Flavobacterium]KAF2519131.1 MBL fold metallo-hydrolase [Flavobacterium salilacus subsp. salilacus]MBE1613310.1 MBL fold metallo-hydrolase [Flavobacterium sp. SaA2.13]
MYFQHVYDKSLAQASYFIGCQAKGEAIVIDAKRDIDTYLEIAKQNNMKITHIAETHIHADFLAGSRELEAATGAKMYLSDEGGEGWQYEFDHIGLKHGDTIKVGNLTLEVLHTPGHTPESISFLLTDHPATDKPIMIFTGDFVFVGDIGRPDLLEKAAGFTGTQEKGAKQMYESIQRFATLPEYVQVWPGHGAGSACGKALGAVPSSTVGYEMIRNWAFQYENNEQGFVDYLLDGQPEPPKYFAMMKHLNKVSRPLLIEVPKHSKLTKEQFTDAYNKGIKVIDTRNKFDFAKEHLPNSINIQGNNSFATWCGWILNYEEQFILVADQSQMDDLTRKLMRIGLDNIYGFVEDITSLDIKTENSEIIDIETFKSYIDKDDAQIVDVRGESEYKEGHIKGAENVFVGTLEKNLDKIDTNKQVVIHCQSGDRAAIAQSLLEKHGIKVKNYSAGMKEWNEKGNETVKS